MPVPNTLSDISPVPASNSPQGTESAKGTIDDYLRTAFAFIAQLANLAGGPTTTLASASSMAVGFANTININITGNAAINGFDVATEGTLRWLVFSGTATLNHNAASFALPGAANIVTAPGDAALFKSVGSGNWRCLSYQRAAVAPNAASASSSGFLSAADWVTFNAKQAALGYTPYDSVNPAGYMSASAASAQFVDVAGDTMGGPLIFPNNVPIRMKDTANNARVFAQVSSANDVQLVNIGGNNWQILNQVVDTVILNLNNSGDLTVRSWTTTSDEREKTNRRPLDEDVLDRVADLVDAGYFDWKDGTGSALGLSAQELQRIGLGIAVKADAMGKLSVDYAGLTAVLVQAMLRREKRRHAAIEARLAALEAA